LTDTDNQDSTGKHTNLTQHRKSIRYDTIR